MLIVLTADMKTNIFKSSKGSRASSLKRLDGCQMDFDKKDLATSWEGESVSLVLKEKRTTQPETDEKLKASRFTFTPAVFFKNFPIRKYTNPELQARVLTALRKRNNSGLRNTSKRRRTYVDVTYGSVGASQKKKRVGTTRSGRVHEQRSDGSAENRARCSTPSRNAGSARPYIGIASSL